MMILSLLVTRRLKQLSHTTNNTWCILTNASKYATEILKHCQASPWYKGLGNQDKVMGASKSCPEEELWKKSERLICENIITASRLFFNDHCTIASDQYVSYNALYQAYAAYLRHVVPHDQLLSYQFMKNPAEYFYHCLHTFHGEIHDKTIAGIGMPKWIELNNVDPNILEKTTVLPMKQRNECVDRVYTNK